jgi:hypothetical protein
VNVEVTGIFVMQGYGGLKNEKTNSTLNGILEQAFKKGSVVNLTISADYLDTVPLCHHQNKYQYECGEILDSDGNCPQADRHYVPEPEKEEVEVTA